MTTANRRSRDGLSARRIWSRIHLDMPGHSLMQIVIENAHGAFQLATVRTQKFLQTARVAQLFEEEFVSADEAIEAGRIVAAGVWRLADDGRIAHRCAER